MKKVLILAYDFPPYVSVGGLRPKSWFDYLNEFEIEPIVITRQWSNKHKSDLDYIEASDSKDSMTDKLSIGIVIRTPYQPNLSNKLLLNYGPHRFRLIRKLITAYYELFQYIIPIGPKKEILFEAEKYLTENKIDCIMATGDPFVLFHYASKLSKKHQIPWIADYRDAWSTIFERQNKPIEKLWNRYFEKKTIPTASHVIAVSEFVQHKTETVFPHTKFTIIPNGYDSKTIENAQTYLQKSDKLRIAMIGSILPWNPIDRFLETFSKFILHEKKEIELIFFGINNKADFDEKIELHYPEIQKYILSTGKMQNPDLMKRVAECNVLLLFNYYSFMGTKIYDYLGLRRKIILCFTDDSIANQLKEDTFPIRESNAHSNQLQADLIAETNSGIAVKDASHLIHVLEELKNEFSKTGQIECNSVHVEKYSRKIQVEKLAEIIKTIC